MKMIKLKVVASYVRLITTLLKGSFDIVSKLHDTTLIVPSFLFISV